MPKSKKKLAARSGTSNVVGPSKPLPLSDLPTLRDSLAFVGLLEEEGRKVDFALMLEVVGEIEKIYARASTSLTLLKKHSIANKLWRARQKQLYFQQSHTHDDKRIAFEKKLDLIFEVLVCQCPMTEDEMGIQIMCSCPLEVKIPKDELPFIFAQRNRSSSLPTLQIGRLDLPKTKIMKKKRNGSSMRWQDFRNTPSKPSWHRKKKQLGKLNSSRNAWLLMTFIGPMIPMISPLE